MVGIGEVPTRACSPVCFLDAHCARTPRTPDIHTGIYMAGFRAIAGHAMSKVLQARPFAKATELPAGQQFVDIWY